MFGCEEKRIEEADRAKVAQLAEGVEVDHGGSRVGAEQRQGERGGAQRRDHQPVGQLVHTQLVGAAVVSCLGQELADPAGQGGRRVLFDPHLQSAGEQQGRCKDPISGLFFHWVGLARQHIFGHSGGLAVQDLSVDRDDFTGVDHNHVPHLQLSGLAVDGDAVNLLVGVLLGRDQVVDQGLGLLIPEGVQEFGVEEEGEHRKIAQRPVAAGDVRGIDHGDEQVDVGAASRAQVLVGSGIEMPAAVGQPGQAEQLQWPGPHEGGHGSGGGEAGDGQAAVEGAVGGRELGGLVGCLECLDKLLARIPVAHKQLVDRRGQPVLFKSVKTAVQQRAQLLEAGWPSKGVAY